MPTLPLSGNLVVFALSAALIWWAGTRLERLADVLSRRTGMGHAFTGMLLLAAATSLPEVATTVTAVAVLGDPELAVHNLVGGVAFQTVVLAVADAAMRRRGALTWFSPRFVLLIEGVALIALLALTIAGVASDGAPAVAGTSVWTVLLAATWLLALRSVYRSRGQPRWTPSPADDVPEEDTASAAETPETEAGPLRPIVVRFAGMSLLVLVAGWFATHAAGALARQTGLGSAFLGATLLAAATSMPELSTTIVAARSRRYTVAVSNVFGSNGFDLALLLLADLLYRDGPVLAAAGASTMFLAALAVVLTCLYMWGLLERADRTILGMGVDSVLVVLTYLGAVAALARLG